MLKADAERGRLEWQWAIEAIARELTEKYGKDTPLVKAIGSLAWGRYDHEPSATGGKDQALLGLGFLQGARYVALRAGETADWPGWYEFTKIHDRINKRPQRRV